MVEEIVKWAQSEIERAEKELEQAEALIIRLKRAGENVATLEAELREAKRRLANYKEAFKD